MSRSAYRQAKPLDIEVKPYVAGEPLDGVDVSEIYRRDYLSPKVGDMLVRCPSNPLYVWLMPGELFSKLYRVSGY
jgi:hypothetical protein